MNLDFIVCLFRLKFSYCIIRVKSSKPITKKDLKLSYYAKYIDLDDNNSKITFNINNQKIIEDEKLGGIKGFVTNDFTLTANEIIKH